MARERNWQKLGDGTREKEGETGRGFEGRIKMNSISLRLSFILRPVKEIGRLTTAMLKGRTRCQAAYDLHAVLQSDPTCTKLQAQTHTHYAYTTTPVFLMRTRLRAKLTALLKT